MSVSGPAVKRRKPAFITSKASSRTVGNVEAELIPSDSKGVVDLVTTGTLTTSTTGVNGPVQLYTNSTFPFQIRQRVYLRPEGIAVDPACARAEGDSVLTGLDTDFQCLLDRLVRKGKLARRKEGRAFVYSPVASRDAMRRAAIQELLDGFFDGSAEQLVLFLPPRFECPCEDLLEMIVIIHGGMKKNNVCALFCAAYFVLQSRMTIDRQRNRLSS